MDIIFHGAYIIQDNGTERYLAIKDSLPYLFSMVSKRIAPVTIKVTGRKDFWAQVGEDRKIRVLVTFEDGKTDRAWIIWSESGNMNRLNYFENVFERVITT